MISIASNLVKNANPRIMEDIKIDLEEKWIWKRLKNKNANKIKKVASTLLSEVWEYAHTMVVKAKRNDRMSEVFIE